MKLFHLVLGIFLVMMEARPAGTAESAQTTLNSLAWVKGPAEIDLQVGAKLSLPDGFLFLDGAGTRKLLAEFGNKTSGHEIGFLTPTSRTWFVVVEHLDIGHIKEDNWRALDSSAILRKFQKSDDQGNAEREGNGWPTVTVRDWVAPPQYDPDTHTMDWAIRAESGGASVVNHTVSLLGRKGAVQFSLIDPGQRSSILPVFRELVRGCSFKPGERYVDHRPGDPIAKGGLVALVGDTTDMEDEAGAPPVEPKAEDFVIRTSPPGRSTLLLAILPAAFVGFVCGLIVRGRGRRHHRRTEKIQRRRTAKPQAEVSAVANSPASPAVPVVPGIPSTPALPSTERSGERVKRYDSYSFYLALTRDLHWTINY